MTEFWESKRVPSQTENKFVVVSHKHKKSFGIAPLVNNIMHNYYGVRVCMNIIRAVQVWKSILCKRL
jgi:hypothetical protein